MRDWWRLAACSAAALVLLPIVAVTLIALTATEPFGNISAQLPVYLRNSLLLLVLVAIGSGSIGVISAWLVSFFDFPGRDILSRTMMLPLAMPPYILAYVYAQLLPLSPPGGTSALMMALFDIGRAATIFSLSLFPYVYAAAVTAFAHQSERVNEIGMTMGMRPWQRFYQITMPIARPAIIIGVMLALMETLADYGTVVYLGVPTFTTGIFRTWFGSGDLPSAALLSLLLMAFVLVLLAIERYSRRKAQFYETVLHHGTRTRLAIAHRCWRYGATALCAAPLLAGFVIPFVVLAQWTIRGSAAIVRDSMTPFINSIALATGAALLTVTVGVVLAYAARIRHSTLLRFALSVATIGYALPGLVIAIGVLLPFGAIDHWINNISEWVFGVRPGLLLSGGIIALLFAYLVRFLTAAFHITNAAFDAVNPHIDDSARLLGHSRSAILCAIHLPLIHKALISACLLVFVDVLKELPATLILRPFNFDTLAVRVWSLASNEQLFAAAPAALLLTTVGAAAMLIIHTLLLQQRR